MRIKMNVIRRIGSGSEEHWRAKEMETTMEQSLRVGK